MNSGAGSRAGLPVCDEAGGTERSNCHFDKEPLGAVDRVNIEPLVAAGDAPLAVLVPAKTALPLLVDFLQNLSFWTSPRPSLN